MKFIQILFSTPMVEAILDGRKKQTRRIIDKLSQCNHSLYKEAEWKDEPSDFICKNNEWYCRLCGNGVKPDGQGIKSKYNVGDILWVRETFLEEYVNKKINGTWEPSLCYYYKADGNPNEQDGFDKVKWKPSIHMPKLACRLFLKVKSLRVERLQDISEEDAIAEGVETLGLYPGYDISSKGKFEGLWNYINGNTDKSWNDNPFVWVIEFERIELTPEQRKQFLNS